MLVDNLAKVNRSLRNSFFAAMSVIVAIAVYDRIVAPHVAYLFALQRHKTVLDGVVKKHKVINNNVGEGRKKLEELRKQFMQVQDALFASNEAKEFFSDLQAISVETSCPIYSLNFVASKPVSGDKLAEDTLGIVAESAMLSVVGAYDNVVQLLERLQTRTRRVWIESLKMETLDDKSPEVRCDMTIKIYTVEDKEAARL